MPDKKTWSSHELAVLKNPNITHADAAAKLGCSAGCVVSHRKQLGVVMPRGRKPQPLGV
jgi:hypothetical protein